MTDGVRTHDNRNHNPGLYQLSYGHHCTAIPLLTQRSSLLYKLRLRLANLNKLVELPARQRSSGSDFGHSWGLLQQGGEGVVQLRLATGGECLQ